ncbi:hypothetical protein NN561_003293 [Cricetulus griseus]
MHDQGAPYRRPRAARDTAQAAPTQPVLQPQVHTPPSSLQNRARAFHHPKAEQEARLPESGSTPSVRSCVGWGGTGKTGTSRASEPGLGLSLECSLREGQAWTTQDLNSKKCKQFHKRFQVAVE